MKSSERMPTTILNGREAIAEYVGRRWRVIKKWIEEEDFPAKKKDGSWMSEAGKIISWLQARLGGVR